MTHPRTEIRDAIKALLVDNTIAEGRVYTNRPNPLTQQASARSGPTQFPAIIIYSTSESSTIDNEAPRRYRRTVEIIVECGREIGTGWDIDEQLDDFARVVEGLLLVDDTLGGKAADLRLTGTSIGIVDQGQKLLGVVALTLEADYHEFFPGEGLPAAPGDLRRVDADTILDGAQASADQTGNTIRLDMVLVRARVTAAGSLELTLSEDIVTEVDGDPVDLLAGFSAEVVDGEDVTAVTFVSASAAGAVLTLVPDTPVRRGLAARVSYDQTTGGIVGEDFELVAFTDRAAANFSEVVGITCSQPLDATLAEIQASFGPSANKLTMDVTEQIGTRTLAGSLGAQWTGFAAATAPVSIDAAGTAFDANLTMQTTGGFGGGSGVGTAAGVTFYNAANTAQSVAVMQASRGAGDFLQIVNINGAGVYSGTTATPVSVIGVRLDGSAVRVKLDDVEIALSANTFTAASVTTVESITEFQGLPAGDAGKAVSIGLGTAITTSWDAGTKDPCGNVIPS